MMKNIRVVPQLIQQPSYNYISKLPNELLVEIFIMSISTSGRVDYPFLLSVICKRWRSIMIGYSPLWTRLYITECSPDYSTAATAVILDPDLGPKAVFARAACFLERSSALDIDVIIRIGSAPFPDSTNLQPSHMVFTDKHFLCLSRLLVQHAYHIKNFSVDTGFWSSHVNALISFRNVPMPRLQSFEICHRSMSQVAFEEDFEDDLQEGEIDVLQHPTLSSTEDQILWNKCMYPSLRVLDFSGVPFRWHLFCPRNLTRLCLRFQPYEERPLASILRGILAGSADTLEILELNGVISTDASSNDFGLPNRRLTLPHVRHFTLGYTTPQEVRLLFQYLDLPAVGELNINNLEVVWCMDSTEVIESIIESLPLHQIHTLTLERVCHGDHRTETLPAVHTDFGKNGWTHDEDRLPVSLRFIRRLTALKHLYLYSPCSVFMEYMNYPINLNDLNDKVHIHRALNMSELETWCLSVSNRALCVRPGKDLGTFLRQRLECWSSDGVYHGPDMTKVDLRLSRSIRCQIQGIEKLLPRGWTVTCLE
ncbi:hypothetical protein EDD18DRAFT_1113956 [Armillaria luteobubalina]|uniref:F-box domain-containing protein n=1 Tax=Armillaria luteobubalina TaxID=153913 RepID=A0AA39P890_9AGAR|nr:hypothetical protein EDD18DRAFT_1113956 [Armillaria luteobubalina]